MTQLLRVIDPRDTLEKARRKELERACTAHKIPFRPGTPAILLRKYLRSNGIVNIEVAQRTLGQPVMRDGRSQSPDRLPDPGEQVPSVGMEADLERQFMEDAPEPDPDYENWQTPALRAEVKKRGLKQGFGETRAALVEKLRHGEDAAQLGQ